MKNFTSGDYIKQQAGQISEYSSFVPNQINRQFIADNQSTITLLEEATRLLGEINAYSRLIPDVDYFIQMHVKGEAVSSSRIEGTHTEIDEILLPESEVDPEKRDDWHEVKNYIDAMNWSVAELEKLPVSVRLLCQTHGKLLSGVRGKHKLPGDIRKSQNWIGGSSIRTSKFIPPPPELISDLLSDWEKFWHNESVSVPILIKVAIMHYQFETIHPFLDGNGRIGRLFITLQLIERGFLTKPILYLSDYFEQNRQAYYDTLNEVRSKNNLEGWVRFFLEGIVQTSKKGREKFEKIVSLREVYEKKIDTLGRRIPRARILLLHLFSNPIISVSDVSKILDGSYKSANDLVTDLTLIIGLENKNRTRRI